MPPRLLTVTGCLRMSEFKHAISMLVEWPQLLKYLLLPRQRYILNGLPQMQQTGTADGPTDNGDSVAASRLALDRNRFVCDPACAGIVAALRTRLGVDYHRGLDHAATLNTLRYLFGTMRCGMWAQSLVLR